MKTTITVKGKEYKLVEPNSKVSAKVHPKYARHLLINR